MYDSFLEGDHAAHTLFLDAFKSPQPHTPERRLMLAVLEDALFYLDPANLKTRGEAAAQYETVAWIFDKEPDALKRLYSFDSVCVVLGIDPDVLRAGIKRYCAKAEADQRHDRICCAGVRDGAKRIVARRVAVRANLPSALRGAA